MPTKLCFVIAPIGDPDSGERKRSDQVLRHLVRPVLEPMGYEVRRADELPDEGLITNQVIQRLIDGDLVVADLTGRNPNVYYELAIRHAAHKAVVHLIAHGETLPFDVANVRAISFALDDPDLLVAARDELKSKVLSIEAAPAAAENPIHAALRLQALRTSEVPESELAGEILAAIADMRLQLKALTERTLPLRVRVEAGERAARLSSGDHVEHTTFGHGEVIDVNSEPGVVVVRFDDGAERKLVAAMAPMVLISQDESD